MKEKININSIQTVPVDLTNLLPPKNKKWNISGNFIPNIPLSWIQKALLLPGNTNASKLAFFIWYQQGVKKTKKDLKISSLKAEKEFGVSKRSFTRALNELENLGMITSVRSRGRAPRVTIIFEESQKK